MKPPALSAASIPLFPYFARGARQLLIVIYCCDSIVAGRGRVFATRTERHTIAQGDRETAAARARALSRSIKNLIEILQSYSNYARARAR